MIARIILGIVIVIASSFEVQAQNSFTAQPLSKNVNSEFNEFNPVISPDGKTLFFTRASHPDNSHKPHIAFGPEDSEDIWFSKLNPDGTWSEAARMPYPLNSGIYNSIHSISDDGNQILINGVFDKKDRWIHRGLSVCTREGDGWSLPQKLQIKGKLKKNKGVSSNAYMTGDGQLLFLSFSSVYGAKKQDLYLSMLQNGKWSKPKKLSKNVNSKSFNEEAPFFDPAQQRLYFAKNTAGRKGNVSEIYFAKPEDNTFKNWSDPVKIGKDKTGEWENYYKLNKKGSWAYFASDKDSPGVADIFRIKIYEENPFVQVKGQVKDLQSGLALSQKFPFKIIANDTIVDSIQINPEDATYVMKLPLGKKYLIRADAPNHKAFPDTIDALGRIEFYEVSRNLFVKAFPYVVLSGEILEKNTHAPLPEGTKPVILVDGREVPADQLSYQNGRYTMNVKYGLKHTIAVQAKNYVPVNEIVDLSDVNEYREIEQDLYVQKPIAENSNQAVVTGKIFDKKTWKPLSPDKSFKVLANEVPASEISINSQTAEYKMILPLGHLYVINASSEGYYPVYEIVDLSKETHGLKIQRDLVIAPVEVGMSIKINNIFFETGKSVIKPKSFPELDRVVKFLNDNPDIKIELAGHTDNSGVAASNMKLSQSRADAVVKYFEKKGIAHGRMVAKGYGMDKPVASNKTKAGKALNRRVEFTILEK